MEQSYVEIEIRHPLSNPEEVIEKLHSLGARELFRGQQQDDRYYVPAHRDFLSSPIISEWLRVRVTDCGASINYERWLPLEAETKTHCDEYETKVDDSVALEKILSALDMKEIVRVKKKRSSWMLDGVEISLDVVENLGTFIECEAKDISGSVEEVRQALAGLLDKIGATTGPRDERGYPYLLLRRDR